MLLLEMIVLECGRCLPHIWNLFLNNSTLQSIVVNLSQSWIWKSVICQTHIFKCSLFGDFVQVAQLNPVSRKRNYCSTYIVSFLYKLLSNKCFAFENILICQMTNFCIHIHNNNLANSFKTLHIYLRHFFISPSFLSLSLSLSLSIYQICTIWYENALMWSICHSHN